MIYKKGNIIMKNSFRKRTSKIAWGFFWLLMAGLVVANLFFEFVTLGIWSIIFAAIAAVVLFHSIATLNIAALPIPIAALYFIFQIPLDLPYIPFWTLVLVTLLVTIGLGIMLPRRLKNGKFVSVNFGNNSGYKKDKHKDKYRNKQKDKYSVNINDGEVIINGEGVNINDGEVIINGDYDETGEKTKIEEGDDVNNPYISVSFGGAVRYLHSDRLESAELNCSFGSLEVYFDNVTLSPEGAEVNVNCSFGNIEIYVPSHWRVIDEMSSSLANAEVSRKLMSNDDDAPTLRVTGSVSLGNVEVSRIKGS